MEDNSNLEIKNYENNRKLEVIKQFTDTLPFTERYTYDIFNGDIYIFHGNSLILNSIIFDENLVELKRFFVSCKKCKNYFTKLDINMLFNICSRCFSCKQCCIHNISCVLHIDIIGCDVCINNNKKPSCCCQCDDCNFTDITAFCDVDYHKACSKILLRPFCKKCNLLVCYYNKIYEGQIVDNDNLCNHYTFFKDGNGWIENTTIKPAKR